MLMRTPATPGAARGVIDRLEMLWQRLWFRDGPTTPLEICRIGIAAAMLLHYALASPYLLTFWGNDGMDAARGAG